MLRTLVEAHLRGLGWTIVHEAPDKETKRREPRLVRLEWEGGYPAYRAPLDAPLARALVKTLGPATGGTLVVMPALGGSIPMELFDRGVFRTFSAEMISKNYPWVEIHIMMSSNLLPACR